MQPFSHKDPFEPIRSLPGVQRVSLHENTGGPPIAVVVVGTDVRERARLRDDVVRCAAEAGITVHPVVYDERDAETLERLTGAEGEGVVAGALTIRGAAGPKPLRRSLLRIVRDLRMAVDAITEPQPVLHHLKLAVCARVVRDGLALLFALHDLPFTADAAAVAVFDREFAGDGFVRRHATLHLRLAGLARQTESAYWATARDDERRFPADDEIDEAGDFLRALERHVSRTLTSDAERAQTDWRRRMALAGGSPLVVLLFFAYLVATRPERPLANLAVITAPGAITGQYFSGEHFERKLFDRDDTAIGTVLPDDRLGGEHFSIRWSGYMLFDQAGRWHLCGKGDDGQRIWFNRRLLVDDWTHDEARTACATVNVERGWYPLRIEYHRQTGPAALMVMRGPPRRSLDAVPPWALCCAGHAGPAPAL